MGKDKVRLTFKQMFVIFKEKYCLVCKSFRFMKRATCKLRCKKSDTK